MCVRESVSFIRHSEDRSPESGRAAVPVSNRPEPAAPPSSNAGSVFPGRENRYQRHMHGHGALVKLPSHVCPERSTSPPPACRECITACINGVTLYLDIGGTKCRTSWATGNTALSIVPASIRIAGTERPEVQCPGLGGR